MLWGGILIACGHYAMAVPAAGPTMSLRFPSLALANGIQAQTVRLYDDVSRPAYMHPVH